MRSKPLSVFTVSIHNLRRKPFRAVCLVSIVAILAFILFGGSILSSSLENGLSSMKNRLGADIMVVPEGYESGAENILIKGEPHYFYFDQKVAQDVEQVEGVSQITTQFFLTSLSEACCSSLIQLIAFDPETDFVIQPWIAQTYGSGIQDGELIAGSDITLLEDKTIKLFNNQYPVVAQLEKTATGLDASIFMTRETMNQFIAASREVGANFLSGQEEERSISSVLVQVLPGYDASLVAKQIRSQVSDVEVIASQGMIAGIASSLETLVVYIRALSVVLWILAALILIVVFAVTLHERKKEFALLRILGATRQKLVSIVLTESVLSSGAGGIIGVALAALVVFPFSTLIGNKLQLPYLQPQIDHIVLLLAASLLLSIIIGPLASLYAAFKISKAETYLTMREGE
jgi:putative ABC transport system permease protein